MRRQRADSLSCLSVCSIMSLMFVCVCVLQDKIKSLEIELDEEKTGTELLNDRVARSREQVLLALPHTLLQCSE